MAFSSQIDLWEMVLSNTTLSRRQFNEIYQRSARQFDQVEYQDLLQSYLNAVRDGDLALAQEQLVALSSATIFNAQADYLLQVLQSAGNPWGGGPLWGGLNSDPWEFQVFNFLINQFVNLYHKRLGEQFSNQLVAFD